MPAHLLPKSEAVSRGHMVGAQSIDKEFIASVVDRWRGAMMSQKLKAPEEETDDLARLVAGEFSTVPASLSFDRDGLDAAGRSEAEFARRKTDLGGLEPGVVLPSLEEDDFGGPPATTSTTAPFPERKASDAPSALSSELQDLRRRLKNRGR
jgi:hypothetical protein